MKKRILSAVLTGVLLIGLVFGADFAASHPAEAKLDMENATALSLMQQLNTADENVIDDKYRTFYEVFVYSFYDSDGNGIGDLQGLIDKLDYINDGDPATDTDLGCNGIWLMPIMPSSTYHKYDVTNYEEIDPSYGTLDDFKTLITECHKRGINVIIDLVMNHTSSHHKWFREASQYLKSLPEGAEPDASECPYVDYYNFAKEQNGGYCELEGTDWYYEAQFWSEMPDLNWDNDAIKAEFEQITKFWLDQGIDGFRLDAVKEFYTGNNEKNIEILRWFNDMVKSQKEDAYIVGEAWTDSTTYPQYYESGIDSLFDFAFSNKDGIIAKTVNGINKATSYGKNLVKMQELIRSYSDTAIDAPFYTNHDMARGAGYYSGDNSAAQTKIAEAMNLLMTGNAFLYYGEELGMKGAGKDENKRAPMYWSLDENAEGMCDGPKDMEPIKMKYDSLEEQEKDGNSIYNYVKQVIALRNQYPAIARGEVAFDEGISDTSICAIQKTYEDEKLTIVFNISAESQTVDLTKSSLGAAADDAGIQIAGELIDGTEVVTLEDNTLTMPAYSIVILK